VGLRSLKAAVVISVVAVIYNAALFALPLSVRVWAFTPLNLMIVGLVLVAMVKGKHLSLADVGLTSSGAYSGLLWGVASGVVAGGLLFAVSGLVESAAEHLEDFESIA